MRAQKFRENATEAKAITSVDQFRKEVYPSSFCIIFRNQWSWKRNSEYFHFSFLNPADRSTICNNDSKLNNSVADKISLSRDASPSLT